MAGITVAIGIMITILYLMYVVYKHYTNRKFFKDLYRDLFGR